MPEAYLNALLSSSLEYIKMWEGATNTTPTTADDTPPAAVANTCAFVFTPAPPIVKAVVTPPANSAGWHNVPATVAWTVTSPTATPTTTGCNSVTVSTDTSGQTFTCTATNSAGQTSASVTIKLDQVAPTVNFTTTPPANVNGWHNKGPVSVNFAVTDDRSGLAAGSPAAGVFTFDTEGQGQKNDVTAVDVAGNTRTVTSPPVNLDKTSPQYTAQ